MLNLKILNILKLCSEQERVNFFFGAIVARTWNVSMLENALNTRGLQVNSLASLLAQVSSISELNNMLMRTFAYFDSYAPNVKAKVNQYLALPINERINQHDRYEAEVLVLDRSLVDHSPISKIYDKDFNLYINIQSLMHTYTSAIYDENDTASALQKLNFCFDKLRNNHLINHTENNPLLRIFMILSAAIIDPNQKADFNLLFKITLDVEINLFAGLNKTRKFLLEMHDEVNQRTWNSVKSKFTYFGDGITPGGILDIRQTLNGITEKQLPNDEVIRLFAPVHQTLKAKTANKPLKRTDRSHNFYTTQCQKADALYAAEVQPFAAAAPRNNRRP